MRILLSGDVLEGHTFDTETKKLYKGINKDRVVPMHMGHYLCKKMGKTVRVNLAQIENEIDANQKEGSKGIVNLDYNEHVIVKDLRASRPIPEIALKHDISSTKVRSLAEKHGIVLSIQGARAPRRELTRRENMR